MVGPLIVVQRGNCSKRRLVDVSADVDAQKAFTTWSKADSVFLMFVTLYGKFLCRQWRGPYAGPKSSKYQLPTSLFLHTKNGHGA